MMNNTSIQVTGRVKWFDKKKGFGFITIVDGEDLGKDVFVHYNDILSHNSSYKYLTHGEYVQFKIHDIVKNGRIIEQKCIGIRSLNGGKLLFELSDKKNVQHKESPNVIVDFDKTTNEFTITSVTNKMVSKLKK